MTTEDYIGYYIYSSNPTQHVMEMSLIINGSAVDGRGIDDVGRFTISGSKTGEDISWVKSYDTHSIRYRGWEQDGMIMGTWSLGVWGSGGFLLRPRRGPGRSIKGEVAEPISVALPFGSALAQLVRSTRETGTAG
jgi:hypothetical protein